MPNRICLNGPSNPAQVGRRLHFSLAAWCLATVLALVHSGVQVLRADDRLDDFHRKVLPILNRHCLSCHSHAANQMESGLALDWKSGWMAGGTRGPAIVPGRPEESLLIQAIRHLDDDLKMPEEKLAADDIEILVEWVRQGAVDDRVVAPSIEAADDWWSLRPLISPVLPSNSFSNASVPAQAGAGVVRAQASHPIDAFVWSRLAGKGLTPSAPATPRDLIRRLYYVLIGLPPSPEEVARFEADPSDANYFRIVDHLLESPRYGERWARHWFDTIHFADSHGYEHDVGRDHAWPYRDYVIQALNGDLPWDTFVRQQLAVDYFQPEATDLLPALGFLGAGTFDYSTYQTGPVTFDYLDRDDMLTQTMAAFVSTTANCARCHAHKFDPIPQEDYYALQAVFAGIVKGDVKYDRNPAIAAERRYWSELVEASQQGDIQILQAESTRRLVAAWEHDRGVGAKWQPIETDSFLSTEGATLTEVDEGLILASGALPETDQYVITGSTSLRRVTALRLELFPHESLPVKGPGRCHNGNLHLSTVRLLAFSPSESTGKSLALTRASADFNQDGWGVERAIDEDPKTAWGIYPAVGQAHQAVFELSQPLELPPGAKLSVLLQQLHGGSHLIGAFRLSVTDHPVAQARALPAEVQQVLNVVRDDRTPEQSLLIAQHAVRELAESRLNALPAQSTVYAAAAKVSIPAGNGNSQLASIASPKAVHLLKRGDIGQPQHEVPPGALSALKHLPPRFVDTLPEPESARRGALADWIAHRDNVLTWRSVVNRVWHYHFGRGLCDTPSDFGRMGGLPTHSELLDWLAIWFRDEARGSLKQLHRLIVTSHTFRQASGDRLEASSIDADNRLLWRQNRMRLDADAYRDFVLSVSGCLDVAMGGPAIQHFRQSPGAQLTPELDYAAFDWSATGSNRRSIYRYVWRGIPDPLMSALDFPDLGLLTPVRSNSASPLQALALFNNSFVLHHSHRMAEQLATDSSDIQQQIDAVVALSFQRRITLDEQQLFRAYVDRHGVAALSRLLFNSNEFLFLP